MSALLSQRLAGVLNEQFESKLEPKPNSSGRRLEREDVMVIIGAVGGLVLLGAVFAFLRKLSYASARRHGNSHIV